MLRKNYISILAAVIVIFLGCWSATAQTTVIGGTVMMVKDGSTVPVAGARVEAYRTDIKGKLPSAKTNKKGEFKFLGAEYGAKFIIAVSGEGIAPNYLADIPAGAEKIDIKVAEGDGKKWTEEEVRGFLTSPPTTNANTVTADNTNGAQNPTPAGNDPVELTAEQKKQKAEYEKQLKEAEEKNKKIVNSNTVTKKSLEEGRKASDAKDYNSAIAKFDEGIQAAPDFAGSAPILMNEKGLALTNRAISVRNASLSITDVKGKIEAKEKVTKDFVEALDTYARSWAILKNAPPEDVKDQSLLNNIKLQIWEVVGITLKAMSQTGTGDVSKLDAVKPILTEYFAAEKDSSKKAQIQVYLADVYRLAGESESSIAEYRKALEMSPDNPDALAGIGLSLFTVGENTNNTAQKQEGLNFMQRFAEVAPASHPLKDNVAEVVAYLKTQNLKPQKTSGGGKKKN